VLHVPLIQSDAAQLPTNNPPNGCHVPFLEVIPLATEPQYHRAMRDLDNIFTQFKNGPILQNIGGGAQYWARPNQIPNTRAEARILYKRRFEARLNLLIPAISCSSLRSYGCFAPQATLTSAQTRRLGAKGQPIIDWFKKLHSSEEAEAQAKKAGAAFLGCTTQMPAGHQRAQRQSSCVPNYWG